MLRCYAIGKPLVATGVIALEPCMPWSKQYTKPNTALTRKALEHSIA